MKVAIYLYGQIRTFEFCIDSIEKFILNKFDCDIFCDIWDNRGISGYTKLAKLNQGVNEHDIITYEYICKYINPVYINIENYNEWLETCPSYISNVVRNISNTATPRNYKLRNIDLNRQSHEKKNSINYDVIILLRPDTIFYEHIPSYVFEDIDCVWNDRTVTIYHKNLCHDTFNIMSPSISNIYCGLYDNLYNIWNMPFDDSYLGIYSTKYDTNRTSKIHLNLNNVRTRSFINSQRFFETYRCNKHSKQLPPNEQAEYNNEIIIYDALEKISKKEKVKLPYIISIWLKENFYISQYEYEQLIEKE